eukprot:scaffold31574_cov124-Isochrysis_galbana.AAC.5
MASRCSDSCGKASRSGESRTKQSSSVTKEMCAYTNPRASCCGRQIGSQDWSSRNWPASELDAATAFITSSVSAGWREACFERSVATRVPRERSSAKRSVDGRAASRRRVRSARTDGGIRAEGTALSRNAGELAACRMSVRTRWSVPPRSERRSKAAFRKNTSSTFEVRIEMSCEWSMCSWAERYATVSPQQEAATR